MTRPTLHAVSFGNMKRLILTLAIAKLIRALLGVHVMHCWTSLSARPLRISDAFLRYGHRSTPPGSAVFKGAVNRSQMHMSLFWRPVPLIVVSKSYGRGWQAKTMINRFHVTEDLARPSVEIEAIIASRSTQGSSIAPTLLSWT